MNSAVIVSMNRPAAVQDAAIHSRSRRAVHFALRSAAPSQVFRLRRAASAPFHQQHGGGQGKDRDEEKRLIADDGPDERHLLAAAAQDLGFGQLVQPGDSQLQNHDHQDHGGHAEEAAPD